MSSFKNVSKANKRIGALHDKVDPSSVLRETEAIRMLSPRAMPKQMRERESSLMRDSLFTDDDLINTHPLEMTSHMLDAARFRINEDEDFAKRYRAATDYTPRKIRGMNFSGMLRK